MGNGTEEDYNFVFKGELGFGKKEEARETQKETNRARGIASYFVFNL